jgi:hypothetical protein
MPAIRHSPAPTLAIALVSILAPVTDTSPLMSSVISPAMSPVLVKRLLAHEKQSLPTITLTNTTTTTTTTSTQPVGEEDQMVKLEQKVHIRCKRLCKHISEKSDDFNLIDFKSIVI